VLDGVDPKYMEYWFAEACELSNASRGQKKVIACTSYQAIDYNTESMATMGYYRDYKVDSWKLEEYAEGFKEGSLVMLAKDQKRAAAKVLLRRWKYAANATCGR
jgi:hypothetical protein